MTKTSPRPFRTIAAAFLAALSLGSCSTFTSSSTAFSIEGENYSKDDLNSLVTNLIAANQLTAPGGVAAAKDLVAVVSVMVQYRAGSHVLADYGASIAEADRKTAAAQLEQSNPQGLDAETKALLVDIAITGQAIDKLKVPADIEKRYAENPTRTGVVCVSETTVKTEAEAKDVLDRVAAGEDFAKVAASTTTNKERKAAQGYVLAGNGSPCYVLESVNDQLSPSVMRALAVTDAATPTIAVQDAEGWHVAMHRPWKEISRDYTTTIGDRTGRQFLAGYLTTADIRVNSTYGTWNPVTSRVE